VILTDGLVRIRRIVKKIAGITIKTKKIVIHLSAFYFYLISFALFYVQLLKKMDSMVFNIVTEVCVLASITS